jgi:formate-dependent nitrite reductase membrane component NrfD
MSQQELYADLEALYRPQRVWAEGRGVLLVAAHFLSGVGAGAWLVGLVLHYPLASLMGLFAVVLGGLVHMGFLGHPERAWKMILKPRNSWISRGLWAMIVFVPSAALYIAPVYFHGAPWNTASAFGVAMLVVSLVGMAGVFLYKGFVYAVAKAVALWHSPILPVEYIAIGIRGGAALALVGLVFVSKDFGHQVQGWWLAATAATVFLFLMEVATGRSDETVARSLAVFLRGRNALVFWVGVVAVGVVVPAVLVIVSYPVAIGDAGLFVAGMLSLVGDLAYKYCMNDAGTYVPFVGMAPMGLTRR